MKTTAAGRGIFHEMWQSVLQAHRLRPALAALVGPSLVDAFLESYVSWREEAVTVQCAYDDWHAVRGPDEALAFAAYRAALDREEHAATLLRESAERIAAAAG